LSKIERESLIIKQGLNMKLDKIKILKDKNLSYNQFKWHLEANFFPVEILDQYLSELVANEFWFYFEDRFKLIKEITPNFLELPNKNIWSKAILNKEINIDKLIGYGLMPNKKSDLVAQVCSRYIHYSRLLKTDINDMKYVCEKLNVLYGSKFVAKKIENFVEDLTKSKVILENSQIQVLEDLYMNYNKQYPYKLRFTALNNQIEFFKNTANNLKLSNITQVNSFFELIGENSKILYEKAPAYLSKMKQIENNENAYQDFLNKMVFHEKLQEKLPENQLVKKKIKI
jgi:hypothetical protein